MNNGNETKPVSGNDQTGTVKKQRILIFVLIFVIFCGGIVWFLTSIKTEESLKTEDDCFNCIVDTESTVLSI